MEWLQALLFGDGIAHSVLVFALVIAVGIMLGKIRVAGVSLGITWILFVGILASHFGLRIEEGVLHFLKEFGLILFIYSVGLQVGPGFFSSFKKGGMQLVGLASAIVLLGVATTYGLHALTGTPIPTMVGVMSGAVTNTPGLGAAQQAYSEAVGYTDPTIALGYAVAYPLGVIGVILSFLLVKRLFGIRYERENAALESSAESKHASKISIQLTNGNLEGRRVEEIKTLINRPFVISRVCRADGRVEVAHARTLLGAEDKLLVVCAAEDAAPIEAFLGRRIEMDFSEWTSLDAQLLSRRILITKPEVNGKSIGELHLRNSYGVTVTRVNRSGVDLIPNHNLELQMGDRLTVVGSEAAIEAVSRVLGNSMRRLREPNLIPIFIGIFLGVLLGSVPFSFPGTPQAVKLGLAGGPLIVAILISRFGPHFKMVTYTTMSANLMLREVGIALFLAGVGLGAGEGFVDTIVNQHGYKWILYGAVITVVPILLVALFARRVCKMNYYTLMGLVAGSTTNPPALAYANATAGNDLPSVSYATVYPIVMFLRVLSAQIFILFAL